MPTAGEAALDRKVVARLARISTWSHSVRYLSLNRTSRNVLLDRPVQEHIAICNNSIIDTTVPLPQPSSSDLDACIRKGMVREVSKKVWRGLCATAGVHPGDQYFEREPLIQTPFTCAAAIPYNFET